jgi:3'-phosphoadenosine 5'-phosphosulfate sulfotransferase (PAPS reductase)/FAD synthetase
MRYVVSLSGGLSSAVAADRTIARYGRENVDLWFANTNWEDEDLHRFLDDLERRWGGAIVVHANAGKNPLTVAEDERIIPNQKLAVCSRVLKQIPFRNYLRSIPRPVTVVIGLDWTELHRHDGPRRAWEAEGAIVTFPLMDPPLTGDYAAIVHAWGIAIPRMYELGFPHNNCGGRCVRQGQKEWLRLRDTFPERFAEVRDWEARQQKIGDARANYALLRDRTGGTLKPLSLAELERRNLPSEAPPETIGDRFGCFCEV